MQSTSFADGVTDVEGLASLQSKFNGQLALIREMARTLSKSAARLKAEHVAEDKHKEFIEAKKKKEENRRRQAAAKAAAKGAPPQRQALLPIGQRPSQQLLLRGGRRKLVVTSPKLVLKSFAIQHCPLSS